jgi:[acyl-carrier-protein] S-malonyltransferase
LASDDRFAILFPGQGAQRVGMGLELAEACPEARAIFDRANAALGFDIARLCFRGPAEELNRTSLCQPAILTASVAALEAWLPTAGQRQATVCAGLSLGEYTALHYARALTFEDAVRLVHRRGQFMEEASQENPGGMAVLLGLDRERVNDALEGASAYGVAEVANLNCPGQIVISGNNGAIQWLAQHAKDFGASRAVRLKVSGAFHSRLMASAAGRLAAALEEVPISQPKTPVVSNVTAKHVRSAAEIRGLLVDQLTRPVLWEDSMRFLLAQGIRRYVEVGPGNVLTGLLGRIDPGAETRNIQAPADFEKPAAPSA